MLTNATNLDEGLQRLVSQANKTGDGFLTEDELVDYFSSRGVAMESDRKYVKHWIKTVDYDLDGKLGWNELKMWGVARIGIRGDIRQCLTDAAADSKAYPTEAGLKEFMRRVSSVGDGKADVMSFIQVQKCSLWLGSSCNDSEVPSLLT